MPRLTVALSRDSARSSTLCSRQEADDERGLAALAQVLRNRDLDLIAQALADRQAGGRVGLAGAADQRRIVLVIAEIGIGIVAALEPERVEADGTSGDAKQVGREQGQRGLGVGVADHHRSDLTWCHRPACEGRQVELRAAPTCPSASSSRRSPPMRRFGGDVELGMDVAEVGERNVAAGDAEGASGQENLAAFPQRDAAVHAGLGHGADDAEVGAGFEAAVVVVDRACRRSSSPRGSGECDRGTGVQPSAIPAASRGAPATRS